MISDSEKQDLEDIFVLFFNLSPQERALTFDKFTPDIINSLKKAKLFIIASKTYLEKVDGVNQLSIEKSKPKPFTINLPGIDFHFNFLTARIKRVLCIK